MASAEHTAAIVRAHAGLVWRFLRYLGASEHEVEDLSQEVLLAIVRGIDRYEGRSELKSWIYGICRNVMLHARRTRARTREVPTAVLPEVRRDETQSRELAARRILIAIRSALATLPEPTRLTFALYELERMPMQEIADALSCTPSTAYSRLYAARAHVRAALEAQGLIEPDQEIAEVV